MDTIDYLNLKNKLDSLTCDDIYNILIELHFPETVAQFFREKMKNGLKTYLFNELPINPIYNLYLNVVLIKLLNVLRNHDTSKLKYPYNFKDPFLIREESIGPLIACFPFTKSDKKNVLAPYFQSNSNKENALIVGQETSKPKSILNSLKEAQNQMVNESSNKRSINSHLTLRSKEKYNSTGNNFIKQIKVEKNRITSLLDFDFKLPDFSAYIEDALNDEDQCIDILPVMSKELAIFLMSNGFFSLSHSEYKVLIEKLLNKYDILYGILNRKAESDYIKKVINFRQKPQIILKRYLSSELIRIRKNDKIMIKQDLNNNNVNFFQENVNEISTRDSFKSDKESKEKIIEISKLLNDSSEALCDI